RLELLRVEAGRRGAGWGVDLHDRGVGIDRWARCLAGVGATADRVQPAAGERRRARGGLEVGIAPAVERLLLARCGVDDRLVQDGVLLDERLVAGRPDERDEVIDLDVVQRSRWDALV